jgi:hypothetical protein
MVFDITWQRRGLAFSPGIALPGDGQPPPEGDATTLDCCKTLSLEELPQFSLLLQLCKEIAAKKISLKKKENGAN